MEVDLGLTRDLGIRGVNFIIWVWASFVCLGLGELFGLDQVGWYIFGLVFCFWIKKVHLV